MVRPLAVREAAFANAGESSGEIALADLFYRGTCQHGCGWRTSRLAHIRKGFERLLQLRALERLVIEQRA
jgi:hypothetical protein